MTDPKLIEAVARAICVACGHDPDGPTMDIYVKGDPVAGVPWAGYRREAQAAITAYEAARGDGVWVPREPTREMMEAVSPFPAHLAKDHPDPADPWHAMMRGATIADQLAAVSIYRAMIAAAKGE